MKSSENAHWIVEIMKSLDLPESRYAVFGSGIMDVLGLKKANDIDLIVTKELFEVLSGKTEWKAFTYPDGGAGLNHTEENIEVFYESQMALCDRLGIEEKIRNAVTVQGVKFVRIEDILAWKRAFGREKDLRDVEQIKHYMAGGTAASAHKAEEGNYEI